MPSVALHVVEFTFKRRFDSFRAGGDFADGVIAYEGEWLGAEEFDSKVICLLQAQGSRARLLS